MAFLRPLAGVLCCLICLSMPWRDVALAADASPIASQRTLELSASRAKAPAIDGALDDAIWKTAAAFTDFRLANGTAPKGKAKLLMAEDAQALYVGIECFEKAETLKSLVALVTVHDGSGIWEDDEVELFLGPAGRAESYYQFIVNAKGVTFDAYYREPGESDLGWEPKYACATRVLDASWVVELALPWHIFDRTDAFTDTWRVQVLHGRQAGGREELQLTPIKGNSHQPAKFARLKGIIGKAPPRSAQARPAHGGLAAAEKEMPILGLAMKPSLAEAEVPATCKAIYEASGIRSGLCLHLGCGRTASATLTADLAASGSFLVHGLALDDASLARARAAIAARHVAGRAMAEKLPSAALPYLADLADLVVVEDMAALKQRGVSQEDILRITAPGGVLCVRDGTVWIKTVKARPAGMDEWTHTRRSPGGNQASADRVFHFPAGLRWLDGVPQNFAGFTACRGMVLAGGRCYTISINERENINKPRPKKSKWHHCWDQYLAARDAFNGLPLWKINCGTTDDGLTIRWDGTGPLVADATTVYTARNDGKVIAVDGATGQLRAAMKTRYPAAHLLLLDHVLVAACWEQETRNGYLWVPASDKGSVDAFDAKTGAALWSQPICTRMIMGSDGAVFLRTKSGAPAGEGRIVALELKSGKERWQASQADLGPDFTLNTVGAGFAVVAKPAKVRAERQTVVLSSRDGHVLWTAKGASNWDPIVDGLLWHGDRYVPTTGESKGRVGMWIGGHGCTPLDIVGSYVLSSRSGSYKELPPEAAKQKIKPTGGTMGGLRGACCIGMVAGNGMLYTAQNGCACLPAHIFGLLAIGPSGPWPKEADFIGARTVEKGPAFGAVKPGPSASDDWPTYRHDAERSGCTRLQLPDVLGEQWKTKVTVTAPGPLIEAWRGQLASRLTAPVAANGMVFVAARDEGRIIALRATSGEQAWSALLGSRIDSPPTIHQGLCLVGCHDGYVYALRATDGQLAWRVRAAPWERRMMAWGAVESVWPVPGAVLVHDNMAYVTAGRSSEIDGGMVLLAFNPADGETAWAKAIGPGSVHMNDILAVKDGRIACYHTRVDPKTHEATLCKQPPKSQFEGAMVDGTWTYRKGRRSGRAFRVNNLVNNLLVWDDEIVATPSAAVTSAFTKTKAAAASRLKPQDYLWRAPLRGGVYAMALTTNAVIYGQAQKAGADGKQAGALVMVSRQDGKVLASFVLDAPPVYDGIAVTQGRVFVSLRSGNIVCFGK